MAVAHDTFTNFEQGVTDTPNPMVINHVPTNTPRGVLVVVSQWEEATDRVVGVTYGGVAMTRVAAAFDAAGEPMAHYYYFLGSDIPTGTQEVAVTHDGLDTTGRIGAHCYSQTADADTEIGDSGILQGDQANPQIALDTGAITSIRYAALLSGQGSPTGTTPVANTTGFAGGGFDFGAFTGDWIYQTTPSSGSFTIGWTATSDDVAMVAVAIQEVAGGTPGSASPAAIAATTTLPAVTIVGPAEVAPAATAATATFPALTVAGSGVSEPATTSTAVTLPAATIIGGGVATPDALTLTVTIPQATGSGGSSPGSVTPEAIAAVVDLLAASIAGAAEVVPGVVALTVTLPQVTVFQPAVHPAGPATAPLGTTGVGTAPSAGISLQAVLIVTGKSAATPNTGKSTAPGPSSESEAE